jgi:hypothetical protein
MAIKTKLEQEMLDLLAQALPFMDGATDCAVCGEPTGAPHEPDCFVPKMKALVDKHAPDDRTKDCRHDKLGMCDYCLIAFGAKHS